MLHSLYLEIVYVVPVHTGISPAAHNRVLPCMWNAYCRILFVTTCLHACLVALRP